MFGDLHIPIDQVTIAVIDVETTGLIAALGDRVCEIAVLRCQGGREVARFESLVNPERPISPGAARVNGLSDAMVRAALRFAEVLGTVEALVQ
ncbi:MAG: DNA polymerase III subunit epsilon, partial [Chloroflexota bacterium]